MYTSLQGLQTTRQINNSEATATGVCNSVSFPLCVGEEDIEQWRQANDQQISQNTANQFDLLDN